jgi:micrococcal nuclease
MYTYNAKVVDITNGDTVVVDIDLGFGVWLRKQVVRMGQINNTELNFAAQDFLKDLVLNKNVLIRTKKRDSEDCNIWIGSVFLKDNNTLIDVNEKVLNIM